MHRADKPRKPGRRGKVEPRALAAKKTSRSKRRTKK
jgi:hypothetical protein